MHQEKKWSRYRAAATKFSVPESPIHHFGRMNVVLVLIRRRPTAVGIMDDVVRKTGHNPTFKRDIPQYLLPTLLLIVVQGGPVSTAEGGSPKNIGLQSQSSGCPQGPGGAYNAYE